MVLKAKVSQDLKHLGGVKALGLFVYLRMMVVQVKLCIRICTFVYMLHSVAILLVHARYAFGYKSVALCKEQIYKKELVPLYLLGE